MKKIVDGSRQAIKLVSPLISDLLRNPLQIGRLQVKFATRVSLLCCCFRIGHWWGNRTFPLPLKKTVAFPL